MENVAVVVSVVSVIAALSGVILGWTGRTRETKKETVSEAKTDTMLRADVDYIKRGIDDIRLEQRAQGKEIDELKERVIRNEESTKQAHKRIDRIDEMKG